MKILLDFHLTCKRFKMQKRILFLSLFYFSSILLFGQNKGNKIKDFGLKNYTYVSEKLPHSESKTWYLTCKMPYNCQFQQWIEIESAKPDSITFSSSNPLVLYLTPKEKINTVSSKNIYEAKNWISGEGAIYKIPAGMKVKSVKYRETGYDTKIVGAFQSNDEDFNVLWKKGARTAYLCMRDWYFDCPDRERVGFWGDGTPELNQSFYAFDSKAHVLSKELVLRKLDPKFYPGQQLEFLGEYGIWFYYLQTGDLETIKTIYPTTKNFLFNIYKPGNKRQWFDWGKENKDTPILETCFMFNDLQVLKKMALITNHSLDTLVINQKIDSIQTSFDAKYWKENAYQSNLVAEPDDRANAMAINVGLATKEKWNLIFEHVLTTKTFSSCFFDRWVFEAMCKIGKEDAALLRMSNRYRTMIDAPFTTLWEHYDRWWASRIDAFDDASSLNHGWNPPVINLSKTISGISPITPGWDTYQVFPTLGFLQKVSVVVPTIKGLIKASYAKSKSQYSIHLNSPLKTVATVGIPKKDFESIEMIKINNRIVWRKSYKNNLKGVNSISENDEQILIELMPGTWDIICQGNIHLSNTKISNKPKVDLHSLNKRNWTAFASITDSSFLFSGDKIPIKINAQNAIDNDHWTGWRDMTKTQYPGQYFMVDMKVENQFSKIVLENSWALWDSPKEYSVHVSKDGKAWGLPISKGKGNLGITSISFKPQKARFIKIIQTGQDPTYHWSIYELQVFK